MQDIRNIISDFITMKMEAASCSETFIPIDMNGVVSQEAGIVMRIAVRAVNRELVINSLQMWQS